jgi:hypothetical protein
MVRGNHYVVLPHRFWPCMAPPAHQDLFRRAHLAVHVDWSHAIDLPRVHELHAALGPIRPSSNARGALEWRACRAGQYQGQIHTVGMESPFVYSRGVILKSHNGSISRFESHPSSAVEQQKFVTESVGNHGLSQGERDGRGVPAECREAGRVER